MGSVLIKVVSGAMEDEMIKTQNLMFVQYKKLLT